MNGGAEGDKAQQEKPCQTFLKDQAEAGSLEAGSGLMDPVWICFHVLARRFGLQQLTKPPLPPNTAGSTGLVSLRKRGELEIHTRQESEMRTPWPLGRKYCRDCDPGLRASPASWLGRRGCTKTTGAVNYRRSNTCRKQSHLCPLKYFFPLCCRVPLPQAPGLRVRRCHPRPDKLLQP